ncbi:MAG TPA: Sec-independent protein translocase protein TatB [Tepidiformaceae bacterium]|nr:Sec-independent protein translocase protein TatB [Tepidiformaceae bacterium]
MEFLGIGYQELLLVLVLLLVVVGPERLPAMAYQIGRAVRQMQMYARAVRDEFKDEIDYLDEQYKTIKGEVDTMSGAVREEQRKLNAELNTGLKDVSEPLSDVKTSLDAEGKVRPFALPAPANGATAKPEPAPGTSTEKAETPTAPPMVF